MHKLVSVFILIFLFSGEVMQAQFPENPLLIETRVHSGLSLPLFKALSYLNEDDLYAFDISVNFPGKEKNYWDKLYNFPKSGIGLSRWSLGNNEIYGRAYVLYYFLNLPLIRKADKFSFNYQIACGGAFTTKKFDVYDNPLNRAIGSSTNIYMQMGVDCRIRILPQSELVLAAGAFHISNGKTRSPNYGINAGSISAGLNHLFGSGQNSVSPEIPPLEKKYLHSVQISAGSKVYDNLIDKRYLTSTISYNFDRLLNHKRKIGLGADLFYDKSIREALYIEEGIDGTGLSDFFRFGLHSSYFIRYKRVMMGIQAGYYLYSRYTVLTRVYSRLSAQYLISENIFGSFSVKSHFGKADCAEWGIGYLW